MIGVSTQLRALMTSGQYQRADLYTLTLVTGTVLRLTSWQVAIVSSGNIFFPTRIGGDRKWKVARGLETDTFSVTIGIDPDNELQINGVPFRQAARAGFLSGARLEMDWAYLDAGVLVGTLTRFLGSVGQVMPDRLGATLTVNSPLKLLDMQVPTKIYGPRCRWTLGDANCGVDLPSFAVAATVGAGATQSTIPCTLGNAASYFNLGIVTFGSGQNQGVKRQVRSYTPGQLILATPLPFAPAANDAISVTPGCDHNAASAATGQMITIGTGQAAWTAPATLGNPNPIFHPAVYPKATIAPDAVGYEDQGVIINSGARAGQAMTRITTGKGPASGQYAVAGNVYTFSFDDHGLSVTVHFLTNTSNATATCEVVFHNAARNGATPFIPPPETAY